MKPSAFLLALTFAASLTACDIIEGPKVDETAFPTSGNKVIIEDFTGHKCGNCPRAHEKAQELLGIYGDNLIFVAVHAGGFAKVDIPQGYITDFNTSMGTELESYYEADLEGLPVGMVNRRPWNNKTLTKYPNWSAAVAAILNEDPKLDISLQATFDETTRDISVTANLDYFTAGDANHQIVALITEDSIVAQQADYSLAAPSLIEDYVQMHVLRTTITPGTWGVPVKGNPIFAGEKITKTFTATLDPAWREHHCEVVVYVLDNTTKQILQAEKVHLTH